ncbi:MAG: carboxypeptidase regulatory-like domain-containing protein [Sedimentisphaerales bacterium]|nr:carboxypeptidase regulatory-like domain-containing protein [Sedimentisphaerales bacterium]
MRRMIVGGCVVLLWAGACFGRTVTVTGRVVDYQARPVSGAEVAVVENGVEWDTQLQDARVRGPIGHTDDQGLFEVEVDIQSMRNVFVVVRKPGLALAWNKAPLNASSAARIHFLLVMEKRAAIAGTVVDATGRAVAQATVRAVPKTCYLSSLNQSPISLPESWLSTRTDGKGRFQSDVFSADVSCDFWVEAPSRHCVYTFSTYYLSGCGYEVGRSDVCLVVPDERQVSGRVVEQGTADPAAGVELEISRPRERGREDNAKESYLCCRVRSDADGRFAFPGVPDGEHDISLVSPQQGLGAWVADPIAVLLGSDHAADDVTFEVDKGGLVEIRVRHAQTHTPLAGIRVSLPNPSLSHLPRTDSRGVARARLRPGESRALISSGIAGNEEYRSWGRQGTSGRFVVQRGETVRLEADLEPAGKISGAVVDSDGKAVPDATVQIHPPSTGSGRVSNIGDQFNTDAEGRFESCCGDADPRGWYVTARCEEKNWAGVAEVGGVDQPVQVRLGPGVTVKGTVVNQEGIGIPAARVTVSGRLSGAVSNITTETLCDASGVFSVSGVLPPDEATVYRLSVDASGYGPESYVEIEVSDQAGAVTDLGQITLPAADESLAGIVVDANDQPVAGVPIFLHSASREVSQPQKTVATDENGRFRFVRICKGAAHLQANFPSDARGWSGTKVEAGQQDVKIVLRPETARAVGGRRLGTTAAQSTPRYLSLTGKSLDQIEDLNPLLPTEAAGKPVLILFMDQQQRPSRRMVQELVGQGNLLQEKEIEVVALQVAGIDRTDLDQWLADEKVPFRVRIVEGGFDKQRYAWGVKSLPWLILTDRDHIVRQEGMGLDEVDRVLRETKDEEN